VDRAHCRIIIIIIIIIVIIIIVVVIIIIVAFHKLWAFLECPYKSVVEDFNLQNCTTHKAALYTELYKR
jgi:flagellar basal body-associated protein FliL